MDKNTPIDIHKLEKGQGSSFISELSNVPLNLNKDNIKQFYSTSIELFKRKDVPEASMNRLLIALCKTMSNKKFVKTFVDNNFALDLPYANKTLHEPLLNLLYVLVSANPSVINLGVATKFCKIIRFHPRKSLIILALYAQHFDEITDPWGVIDILLKETQYFRQKECAEDYASLLVYLCQHFEDYRKSRLENCWNVICEALNTENVPSLITFYYSLCQLYELDPEFVKTFPFPTAEVAIHLRKPAVARSAISLLLRITPKHHLSNIVQGLIAAAQTDVHANLILSKMATKKSVAEALIHDATWMTKDLPDKIDTMRLFAVVISHIDLRPLVLKKSEVIDFFKNISTLDSSGVLTAVCTFIRRLPINANYCELLSKSEFLGQYFATAMAHTDDTTIQTTLLMIHSIAKITFVREFANVCDYVVNLIKGEGETSRVACKVAAELAKYPKCAVIFQNKKLDDYFLRRQKDPKMKRIAVHFLRSYSNALNEPMPSIDASSGLPSGVSTPKRPKYHDLDIKNDPFSESEAGRYSLSESDRHKSSSTSSDSDPDSPKTPKLSITSLPKPVPHDLPTPIETLESPPPPTTA